MKVKELIEMMKGLEDFDIVFSQDEELNLLRNKGEVALLNEKTAVIYGFDGSEVELDEFVDTDDFEDERE